MTVVLGVNGFPGLLHDPGAAVVVDGQIVAVVEDRPAASLESHEDPVAGRRSGPWLASWVLVGR